MNSAPHKPHRADDRSEPTPTFAVEPRARFLRSPVAPSSAAARALRGGQQILLARMVERRALGVAVARLSRLRAARPCALAAQAASGLPPRLPPDGGGIRGGCAHHRV